MTQPISDEETRETVLVTVDSAQWTELVEKVDFIYRFLNGFAESFVGMSQNPMMRTMARNFGIDVDGLQQLAAQKNDK